MTTADQINPFDRVYWNLIQTLAWIHLRKDEVVKLADDDVTDWGTHEDELITPDGKKRRVDISNSRPSALTIEIHGALGAYFENLGAASTALIRELQSEKFTCYGIANNEGELKEIPSPLWADLKFWYEPDLAGPKDLLRPGAIKWYNLKFKVSDLIKLWPPIEHQSNKRTLQKLKTTDRNQNLQAVMNNMAKIKIENNESFTLKGLAKEIHDSGEFKNISFDTILRNTKKTW